MPTALPGNTRARPLHTPAFPFISPFGAMMVPMINQMFAQLGGSGAPV